jgi:hypothetical protein
MSKEFTVRGIRLLRPLHRRRGVRRWLSAWITLLTGDGSPHPSPGLYIPLSPQAAEESGVWLGTIHIAQSTSNSFSSPHPPMAVIPDHEDSRRQVRHIFQQNRIHPRSNHRRARVPSASVSPARLGSHRAVSIVS